MQQKILIGFILTFIIVIFVPVYWAMEPGRQEAARIRQQTEAVERGAATYSSVCANCHGAQGEGMVGPALKGTSLDDDALAKIIVRGIPGTAMTAWGDEDGGPLKSHQIDDLVNFIKHWESAPPPKPTLPLPTTPPTIDAYQSYASSCAVCHGVNRQGVSALGPALTPESLAKLSDAEIRDVILNGRAGTPMPAFKSTLSTDAIDALLQFIKNASP
jgi:cbb3-type cytochrome c oxidase subunit III